MDTKKNKQAGFHNTYYLVFWRQNSTQLIKEHRCPLQLFFENQIITCFRQTPKIVLSLYFIISNPVLLIGMQVVQIQVKRQ